MLGTASHDLGVIIYFLSLLRAHMLQLLLCSLEDLELVLPHHVGVVNHSFDILYFALKLLILLECLIRCEIQVSYLPIACLLILRRHNWRAVQTAIWHARETMIFFPLAILVLNHNLALRRRNLRQHRRPLLLINTFYELLCIKFFNIYL